MKRRTFLSTLATGLAGTAAVTAAGSQQSAQPREKHADISLFMTDEVQELTRTSDDPYHATNLIAAALERTLPTIPSDGQTFTYTIRTETTVIDESEITPDADRPVDTWETALEDHVPPEERGADTNLLLTNETANIAGQGNMPCDSHNGQCDSENTTAAIIMNAGEHLAALPNDAITGEWDLTTSEYILQVAVHEVGHTIGLTHSHGTGEDGTPATVTPMLGTYIFTEKYAGSENRYNQELPEMNNTDAAVCRPEFNPHINLDDITTVNSS